MYEVLLIAGVLVGTTLLMWLGDVFLRRLNLRRRRTAMAKGVRITRVWVDPDICTADRLCLEECPEVLEFDQQRQVARVRQGAEAYYSSHAEQIVAACDVCPTAAIQFSSEPA